MRICDVPNRFSKTKRKIQYMNYLSPRYLACEMRCIVCDLPGRLNERENEWENAACDGIKINLDQSYLIAFNLCLDDHLSDQMHFFLFN